MSQVMCCCFSPDGSTILSGSHDHTLKLWRTCDGSLINTLNGHTNSVTATHFNLGSHITQVWCCCFSPDGSTILSGANDNTLKLWRTCDGSLINTLTDHTATVTIPTFILVLMSHRYLVVVFPLMVPPYCLALMTIL